MKQLRVENLSAGIENKQILNNISFTLNKKEIHVIMGPNGAGKSTISNVLMGHPKYNVTSGKIYFDSEEITKLSTEERAKKGLFMSFQHPAEIPGVTMSNFLRTSYNQIKDKPLKLHQFHKLLKEKLDELEIEHSFKSRNINEGFSGGEKKRSEILQLLLLEPEFAILDEIDSGLDVDALKLISKTLKKIVDSLDIGILIITHNSKILKYLNPDKVYVVKGGEIFKTGSKDLIDEIELQGFN